MVKSTSELKMSCYADLVSSYTLIMCIGIILHVMENEKFAEIHA